jgi:UDP-GlcNAc:undecaprenyl-phosphate/decaprenyl-phosphate GlcNAc-1-phosphate transferase
MTTGETALFLFLGTFAVSCVLTLGVRELARKLRLTDKPDGRRKLHRDPTPLGGGVAVYLATLLVAGVLLAVPNRWQQDLLANLSELAALAMASGVIVLVGLLDDKVHLRGRHKVLGQLLAVTILVFCGKGLVIEGVSIFGGQLNLHYLAIPCTYFWLLGAINAVNLLDGIDGLATMLGIILVATFALLAAMIGRSEIAVVAWIFAGSLCGFMRFNFPPASIFLGDAGSMLIGLVVGALAIQGSLKGPGTVLLAAPLAVWTMPIFDSAAAILRRKLTGRSIYTTDRGHLHHRLMDRLGSNRKVLGFVAASCGLTSGAALIGVYSKSDLGEAMALAVCLALVAIFVAGGLFGRAECILLWTRARQWVRGFWPWINHRPVGISETTVRLQGSRPWEVVWMSLTEAAEKLSLARIHLDLNLPMVHEGFTATWEHDTEVENCWQVEIPLLIRARRVGRLLIMGRQTGASASHDIERLLELIEPVESRLRSLALADDPVEHPDHGVALTTAGTAGESGLVPVSSGSRWSKH